MKEYSKALATGVTETVYVDKAYNLPALTNMVVTLTDNYTITSADNGKTFLIGTDAKVITLPATIAGFKVTIINSGADGNNIVTISPAAADAIHGTTNASTNVVFGGVDNKDIINTKATATTGDNVTLLGDGNVGWYVIGCHGIWASEG